MFYNIIQCYAIYVKVLNILQFDPIECNLIQCNVMYWNVMKCTALYSNVIQYNAM